MTTVTAVKQALEEILTTRQGLDRCDIATLQAFRRINDNPVALTILANRLSDRGTAGNDARAINLAYLSGLTNELAADSPARAALEWAVDQLTPPEPASYIERADCPTPLGEVCRQGQRCCQRRPGR